MPIIEFENVQFSYEGDSSALDAVSLYIEQGDFVCVLGGNGSGKSTLAKHINAILVPDAGKVSVFGLDTRATENAYIIRSNSGMVFQNPDDQIVASIIEDDIAFGPENLGVPANELRNRVTDALEKVGLQGFEKCKTTSLSGGQKQRVAIAGALALKPQILIFDEASAMLDPRGRSELLSLCIELNNAGLTILYITHFMEEAAVFNRVIVLEAGCIVLDGSPDKVLIQVDKLRHLHLDIPFAACMSCELQHRGINLSSHIMLSELVDELQQKCKSFEVKRKAFQNSSLTSTVQSDMSENAHFCTASLEEQHQFEKKPLLKVANVSFTYQREKHKALLREKHKTLQRDKCKVLAKKYMHATHEYSYEYSATTNAQPVKWGNSPGEQWALRNVSLTVERGEFLGIAGHTGSGKSTLIQIAAGLLQPNEGHVFFNGIDLSHKRHSSEVQRDVCVVFQFPERQLFANTVFDDVAFGPRNLGFAASEVELRVRKALATVHLDFDTLCKKSPFALSGGQQRRVAIAGVLAMNPQILILDEPTAGLDPYMHASLLELVSELHDNLGLTIIIVSHNMDDLARLCSRVALLNRGELVSVGSPAKVFSEVENLHSIGLDIPHTLQLANALSLPDYGTHIPSIPELVNSIAQCFADNTRQDA